MLDIKKEIKDKIPKLNKVSKDEINFLVNEEILRASSSTYIDDKHKADIKEEILNEIMGFGKLEKYLKDESINEIMINGPQNIFIEKNNKIVKAKDVLTKEELDNIIQKIVSDVNKSISFMKPIVDARMKDGSRVNIVNNPVAVNGPVVTIRKFSKELLGVEDLIKNDTLNEDVANFLKSIVEKRYNIFVSGGTGSGKTTLLNVLSNFISENERIVTIEDSCELKLKHIKNIVTLEARDNNIDNIGKITIRDLLIASLRMRPDRIIVGEVRGVETFDMLQAMNTGHDGSLSTGHANSSKDMLTRLESMVIMGYDMPLEAIKRQIASSIDIIIHIGRVSKGKRKILEVCQLMNYENGNYVFNDIYKYDQYKNEIIKVGNLIETK